MVRLLPLLIQGFPSGEDSNQSLPDGDSFTGDTPMKTVVMSQERFDELVQELKMLRKSNEELKTQVDKLEKQLNIYDREQLSW